MPEEKKEKFTFSDKIKNSKMSANKSFAKSSSKIGRDGKPKQTLFERTRRDAPFFIAALVALLLLPFLYKYSGQSSEESAFAPVNEESMFDPERYGFDTAMIEDPDGQIAQLSGRDSLSLIKGWGVDQEADYGRDDMDFDSSIGTDYDAQGRYAKAHQESSDMDVEENTTNIYKKRAKAGTRAAFRRAVTKVGSLNPATMRRGNGAGLNVKNFGGGLKNAAQKVKPAAPASAPKPVSLQPLQAKSGRSVFGGTGAAGRKSRDAMGKADAVSALRDANVKPVDPTRVGGLDMFSMGPGGGGGKLGHTVNIGNGKEPWWWDMMKTRMQKEWEAEFERKWNWIKFWDSLAQDILKKVLSPIGSLLNCLIWGDDDGDVDAFLGAGGGAGGKAATCCGLKENEWNEKAYGPFSEDNCKKLKGEAKLHKDMECKDGWDPGRPGDGARVGMGGQRLKCLGLAVNAYASGDLNLKGTNGMNCVDMPTYKVIPSGEARKWNIYTYVVVRNYFPDSLKKKFPKLQVKDGKKQNLLCAPGQSSLNHADITAGVGHVKSAQDAARQQIIVQTSSTGNVPAEQQEIRTRTLEIDQESLRDACVIVVSRGNLLPYEAMKNKIMDLFKDLDGQGNVTEAETEEAFYQLDLMFVGSFAAKDKLAYSQWFESGHRLKDLLPLPYWEFENAYIEHKKITHKKDGSRDNVYNKKRWRIEGLDMVRGPICYYGNLNIECGPDNTTTAMIRFDKASFKGGSTNEKGLRVTPSVTDVQVSAEFRYLNNPTGKGSVEQPMITPEVSKDGFTFTYTFNRIYSTDTVKRTNEFTPLQDEKLGDLVGNIVWTAKRGKQIVTRTCPLNLSGEPITPFIPKTQCTAGEIEKSPKEKVAGQCQKQRVCSKEGTWGDWVNVPGDKDCEEKPPQGQGQIVHFYDLITKVPCTTEITNGPRRVEDKNGCLTWNTCKLTQDRALLLPLDADTKAYVKRAQAKFNQANADKKITLTYNEESLSVANLIDAIMIDPDGGTVPANTVCLLGKTLGANAKDPQAPAFDNLFGVFLAFIGYDAASFPSQKTYDCDGNRVTDRRFLCRSDYYWGGYVNSKERINYEKQVDSGVWKDFPLKELLRNPLPKNGTAMQLTDRENRVRFHGAKPNGYADLMRREPCQYDSNQKVSRQAVIEYINRLCANGDQMKPKATKKYDCAKMYSDGTHHQQIVDCPDGNC